MEDSSLFEGGARATTMDLVPPGAPAIDASVPGTTLLRASREMLLNGQALLNELSPQFLVKHGMFVYEDAQGLVHVAIADAAVLPLVDTIAWTLQRSVVPELAGSDEIMSALQRASSEQAGVAIDNAMHSSSTRAEGDEESVETLRDMASGAPIVRAVNEIIGAALERRATDIHFEPTRKTFRVRIRVDGILTTLRNFAPELGRPIVSRVKILSALNIADRRLPQDGRTRMRVSGREVDIRVATMPTGFGEAAILRLLQREKKLQTFDELGLSRRDFDVLSTALKQPHGMIVVTGPTGSGKTTTLAAALTVLNDATRKILTAEDPIEYEIDGVGQTQVRSGIGLTFANALRSFLRQDPDVIMVGEMRDAETARVAIQASLTGHLVLTTLHTNTAAAAITRLVDLGIEPFLLSATLQCVVAQRLVRILCQNCRAPYVLDTDLFVNNPRYKPVRLKGRKCWNAGRCERCAGTGYVERRAVFEVLKVTDEIRHMISQKATELEIEATARAAGMTNMVEDGVRKVLVGETSLDEVLRVTASQ